MMRSLIVLFTLVVSVSPAAYLDLSGPYLGQPSPGMEAQVFAPGFISKNQNMVWRPMWTPDGLEFYYSASDWYYMQGKDGLWTEPKRVFGTPTPEGVPLMFKTQGLGMGPAFSGDGQRVYVATGDRIWMSERIENGWSAPRDLQVPLPDLQEWWISVTNDGTLYLTLGQESTETYDIYRARPDENGAYPTVEKITDSIGAKQTFYQQISPDESVLVLTQWNQSGGYGTHDLYVSFRNEQDQWTRPRNLGPKVNTPRSEMAPFFTADSKYLFYSSSQGYSGPGSIYWIEAHAVLPDLNGPIENQTTGQRFSSIQCAINYASAGDTIVIEPGVYEESITLDKDIVLQSVDPNDPYYIGSTIILGTIDEPVLTLADSTEACKIAGLTLRAGSVGILGMAADATLSHCRIMDNVIHGMELSGANPTLQHCLISGNGETGITMYKRGRSNCQPRIENCVIVDNGGEAMVGGEPVIVDSIIQ